MLSPHESVLVHQKRGLLGAVMGNAFANVGILDLYDLRQDCRHPKLVSSTRSAFLGHESGWSPDGKTFYATGSGGQSLTAIDVTDPATPEADLRDLQHQLPRPAALAGRPDAVRRQHRQRPERRHPARRGPAHHRRQRDPGPEAEPRDQDAVQPAVERGVDPAGRPAVHPQGPPLPARGRRVLPVRRRTTRAAPVGAARIIAVDDPRHPKIVSGIRLEVHQPGEPPDVVRRPGREQPARRLHRPLLLGAVRQEPADRRLLDDQLRSARLRHQRPQAPARGRLLQPPRGRLRLLAPWPSPPGTCKKRMIWFTDTGQGFYAVKLTNGVGKLLKRR